MNYDLLYPFVCTTIEQNIPAHFTYHDLQHTLSVIENAMLIADAEDLSEEERLLLKTAALLHDVGFIKNPLNHEVESCRFAKQHLPDFDYSQTEIEKICKMIMATKLPQSPTDQLSEILCDADLYYLGSDNYTVFSARLFSEFKALGIIKTDEHWHKRQIEFLHEHRYFRRSVQHERDEIKNRNKQLLEKNKPPVSRRLQYAGHFHDFLSAFFGIIVAAFALSSFLVPNHFFDGGVTGVSLLIHEIYDANLAVTILLLNLPLVALSFFTVGRNFAVKMLLSVIFLGLSLWLLPTVNITHDKLIVAVFGGAFLGIGVGLVMRAGAALDGIEVLALYTLKKTSFTITEIILGLNILIFSVAAFKFGIETSLYSVLTYFSATRAIDYVVEGIQAYTGVTIISAKSEEIKYSLVNMLGRGITVYKGERGFLPGKFDVSEDCDIIYTVITRLELRKLKNVVYSIDPKAFVFANTIREAAGGILKRRAKH